VLPYVERQEDWDRHLERTYEALSPVGYIEETLVDRIALLFWKLKRLARYERTSLASSIQVARAAVNRACAEERRNPFDIDPFEMHDRPPPAPDVLDEAAETVAECRAVGDLLKTLVAGTGANESEVPRDVAAAVLELTTATTGIRYVADRDGPAHVALPRVTRNKLPFELDWTVTQLRECLQIIGARAQVDLATLMTALGEAHRGKLELALATEEALRIRIGLARETRMIPDAETRDRLSRYEAQLERSLYRALHELERRQAVRLGALVAPPVAVDVSVDTPETTFRRPPADE